MTFREFEKRLFRWFMKGLLATVVFVVACYFILWGLTVARERALEREWIVTVGLMQPFLDSLATQGKNAGAVQMEEILQPVGITLVPPAGAPQWTKTRWTFAQMPIHDTIEREMENPGSSVDPPPPEVAAFLDERSDILDAVCAVLLAQPPPQWGENGARPWTQEPPRTLGFVHLAQWLAVDALAKIARGDSGRAVRNLEASYVLGECLAHRLELTSQIAAVALQEFQAGLVRKLDPVPPHWRGRLQEAYNGEPLRKAFAYEAYNCRERGRRVSTVPFYRKMARNERLLWRTFGRLWYRLSMADVSSSYLEQMRELEKLGPCALDYFGPAREIGRSLPWWNTLGKMGLLNLGQYWERGIRLQVDAELTAKVLDIREARDRNGGAWPPSVPGIEVSRCSKARFVYAVKDGAVSLAFDRVMKVTDRPGKITLPLWYTAAAPTGEACAVASPRPRAVGEERSP